MIGLWPQTARCATDSASELRAEARECAEVHGWTSVLSNSTLCTHRPLRSHPSSTTGLKLRTSSCRQGESSARLGERERRGRERRTRGAGAQLSKRRSCVVCAHSLSLGGLQGDLVARGNEAADKYPQLDRVLRAEVIG